jgi:hypothetical protein
MQEEISQELIKIKDQWLTVRSELLSQVKTQISQQIELSNLQQMGRFRDEVYEVLQLV